MTTSTVKPGLSAALASPFTPIAVINGTPVYALQGGRSGGGIHIGVGDDDGSPDDDLLGDGGDDDDDDDEDDDGDEPDDDELDEPTSRRKTKDGADRDALARMEVALRKANGTAAKFRRAGKTMERLGIEDLQTWLTERGIDPETGVPFGTDVVDPDDGSDDMFEEESTARQSKRSDRETTRMIRTAEQRAEVRAREKYVPILAQQAATNAFREAGFKGSPTKLERLLRMVDATELDVTLDDEGFEIDGLDEQIASIRDDFPEMFEDEDEPPARRRAAKSTTPARRASGARDVDGGGRGRPAKKQGSWVDQIVAQMDKRGR